MKLGTVVVAMPRWRAYQRGVMPSQEVYERPRGIIGVGQDAAGKAIVTSEGAGLLAAARPAARAVARDSTLM